MFQHDALPGYRQLTLRDRLRVDTRAAVRVCGSVQALHVLACIVIWLLAGYTLVWHLDLRGHGAHLPVYTLSVWLLPWLAAIRRRVLRELLGPHWSEL